ncbi:GntR family transcriptional regulator [Thalassospiraceae bacterium LMO-JJ14]|nr:GntR family transcriptional regulator [Thalassospiraceae bacterium LMO-JJ14]
MTTVQQIYSDLRNLIVDLTLPPGTVLSKNEIADRYRVSQTPVREAMILLEEEGLVDIFPQSRTEVSCIDVQSAREAHFLRRSVEVEIARILAQDISKSQISELRDSIALQVAADSINDYSSFTLHDNRFHELMYKFAGVGGLWNIVDGQRAHLDRLRRLHLPTKGKVKSILRDHKAIVKTIASHDVDAAEAAVREHLKGTVFTSEELRAHFPEYFVQSGR